MRVLYTQAGLILLVSVAAASPYWIRYDGTAYPETEGWERVKLGSPERWLEEGALVLESRESYDKYRWTFLSGGMNPATGETFLARWRLKIDSVAAFEDPGVDVVSDDLWSAGFVYAYDRMLILHGAGGSVAFTPGVYHEYELRSNDMRSYTLAIDGVPLLQGAFVQYVAFPPARVTWGDLGQGNLSLARWDYVEFGVVPEPCSVCALLVALTAQRVRRRARTHAANAGDRNDKESTDCGLHSVVVLQPRRACNTRV